MLFSQPWETVKVNRLRDKNTCKSMKTFQELQVCPVPHCRDPNKLSWLLVCLKRGLSELVPTWSLPCRHAWPQGHATYHPLALCCLKACKAIPCQHVISSPLNRWTWPMWGLKMSNFQANPWKAGLHSFPNDSTYAFPIWMPIAVSPQAPNTSPQFPDLILSGFPWFGSIWCHPHLSSTSAAILPAGCWWPSCVFLPQLTVPAPRVGGPGRSKQTNRPTSKPASAACPPSQLSLPICWQWKNLPPGNARASNLYPPWLGSCGLWALVLSSFLSSQGKQKEKEGWRHSVGKLWLRLCCVLQPWPKSHGQKGVLNAGCQARQRS